MVAAGRLLFARLSTLPRQAGRQGDADQVQLRYRRGGVRGENRQGVFRYNNFGSRERLRLGEPLAAIPPLILEGRPEKGVGGHALQAVEPLQAELKFADEQSVVYVR